MDKKMMKNIATGVCAGLFIYSLIPVITGNWVYQAAIYAILMFVRILCLLFITISLYLSKNKIGGFTKAVAVVFVAATVFRMVEAFRYWIPFEDIIVLALFIGMFLMAVKAMNGELYDTKDTTSEAAKVEQQGMKQEEIYAEQLKDGILTREEYDTILENKREIMAGR